MSEIKKGIEKKELVRSRTEEVLKSLSLNPQESLVNDKPPKRDMPSRTQGTDSSQASDTQDS